MKVGVAFRVLAALLVIVVLAAGLGAYALTTFGALRGHVEVIANERLPSIVVAARLDRQAAALSAQAAALALAETDGGRETEMMRILDLVATLDTLIEDLDALTGDVAGLRAEKDGFVETLHRLNRVVAERNAVRESLDAMLATVLDHDTVMAVDSAVPAGASQTIEGWRLRAVAVLHAIQAAGNAGHPTLLARKQRGIAEAVEAFDVAVAALPPADRGEALALRERIAQWLDPERGIPVLRAQLLRLNSAVDGTLARNRALADLLGAASAKLFQAGDEAARAAAAAAAARFETSQLSLAGVLAASGVVVLLTVLYLRESVILRLRRLQEAMAGRIAGRRTPIPVDGTDEVADMGRNLSYFLSVIEAREAELRETEQLFRTLALTAPFPLLMLRVSDGRILQHNRRAAEYLELDEEAPDAWPDLDALFPDPGDREALMAVSKTPLTDREVRVRTASGRVGWALLSAAPATVRGEPVVLVGVVDIAERRRAEEAVRESERKYRGMLENLRDHAVFAHDVHVRFTYISPSVRSVVGYPPEIIARDYVALMPPEEVPRWRARQRQLQSGEPFTRSYETAFVQPDGSRRTVAVVETTVLDDQGRVVGVEGVAHDVTAQKTYEAHLQSLVRELEQSNAELASFAYVASHDLREPLRMVTSYLGLLQRRYGADLPDEAREFMTYASEGARRMDRLILDLLEYSRVGRADRPTKTVDVRERLEAVLENLSVAIAEAGAEVRVNGVLPVIEGDPTDVDRLLQNLIGNAVKYRHPDRPPRITVSAERLGDQWRLTVRDNGIGVPPGQTERIFKIFQRLHPRSLYDGTGIGLAVCRKVAESMGGRIWCEPNGDGGGTAFHVTLPVARKNAA